MLLACTEAHRPPPCVAAEPPDPEAVATAWLTAIEEQRWADVESQMSRQFVANGMQPWPWNTMSTVDRTRFVESLKAWSVAMPKLRYTTVVIDTKGQTASVSVDRSGAFSGVLTEPLTGLGPIEGTGAAVQLPTQFWAVSACGTQVDHLSVLPQVDTEELQGLLTAE